MMSIGLLCYLYCCELSFGVELSDNVFKLILIDMNKLTLIDVEPEAHKCLWRYKIDKGFRSHSEAIEDLLHEKGYF